MGTFAHFQVHFLTTDNPNNLIGSLSLVQVKMAGTVQASKAITLTGSAEIVAEYFHYGINSILYQRGIYPAETFTRTQKFGSTLLVTTDEELNQYLSNIIDQVKEWLLQMTIQKLVLVVRSIDTNEVVERWQFEVKCEKSSEDGSIPAKGKKTEEDVKNEIRSVIRQITASVSFLPLLETPCSFEILVYTDKDLAVPEKWGETGPAFMANSEVVKFRSFSTSLHAVDSMVAFKKD